MTIAAPLRGGKGQLFEGGLRVPFIACWPGRLPAGRVCDDFLSALEIFPTLAKVAGAKPDRKIPLDGFDMMPVLRGEQPSPRCELFWEWRNQQAARVDDWKWVASGREGGLFDLRTDQGEQRDRADEQPDCQQQVQARFAAWRAAMEASEPRGPFRDY